MKKLDRRWKGPLTIWSKNSGDNVPTRFLKILTIVLPIIYALLILFGIFSIIWPIPAFESIVGTLYGAVWSSIVAISASVSLIALIFKWKLEIYSAIVLAVVLCIYPFYIGYLLVVDPTTQDLSRAVIFAAALCPVIPAWRAVDLVLDVRKSRLRQLYALSQLGVKT